MPIQMTRRAAASALACLLAIRPRLVQARPYRVEDLLALEELGPVFIDPGERWLILSTSAPWKDAPRFDLDYLTSEALGRLQVVDLDRPGPPRPLLPPEPGVGLTAGPFSPSGDRLAVLRLHGHERDLGVVTLATGAVRWLGAQVDVAPWGRSVQWVDDDTLVAIVRPAQAPSRGLGYGWQVQARLAQAWGRSAAGELAVTALGAGRYEGLNPRVEGIGVVRFDMRTGASTPLLRGEAFDLEVAPGGRHLAVLVEGEPIPVRADDGVTPSTAWRRIRLKVVDLAGGQVFDPLPGQDLVKAGFWWSSDGESLLAFARPDGGDWDHGALHRLAVDGARLVTAPASRATPQLRRAKDGQVSVQAGFAGAAVVVFGAAGPDDAPAWRWPDGRKIEVPAAARLAAMDRDGASFVEAGGVWRVAPGRTPRRQAGSGQALLVPAREAVGVRLLTSAWTGPRQAMARRGPSGLAFQGGGGLRLSSPDAVLAFSPARRIAVVQRKSAAGVSQILLRGSGGDQALLTLNAALAQVDTPTVRPIRHVGPDGQALTSWLYRPSTAPPDARLPVIVVPYPGSVYAAPPPFAAPDALLHSNSYQLMVGQGYAVIVPSLPMKPRDEPGAGLAQRILALVDQAAADGGVDPGRVALWGQSFGGYGVLMAATQSPRFSAIVASAPITDLVSFWGSMPPQISVIPEPGLAVAALTGWAENGQGHMRGPPWRDPDRWRRNSPLMLADRIAAPVMLVQGDLDAEPNQTMAMFTALARQGKDVILLTYRGEAHVVISPANVRDLYARAFSFLRERLGPPAPS